jgi:ankyrin repeat protein
MSQKLKKKLLREKLALNNSLLEAADAGNLEKVKLLVEEGADVNYKNIIKDEEGDVDGETALINACLEDNLEMAKLLVSLGADVNIPDNFKQTPLMYLCEMNLSYDDGYYDFVEFVKFLLYSGADINIRDSDGHTVLYIVKVYFPDENPNKKIIIDILEKWPTTMGILALKEHSADIEDTNLFEFMGKPRGGKRRKSKKRNKKSKKRKTKKSKRRRN